MFDCQVLLGVEAKLRVSPSGARSFSCSISSIKFLFNSMLSGNYMSEHDKIIAEKLGFVLCGGDLSENTNVSEQYLLDLERKAFLELCRERKTLERLESIVKYGKILRN